MATAVSIPPASIDEAARGQPAAPLRGLIAAYDGYRQRGVPASLHRGLPSPFMTMIVTLYEPLHIVGHLDARTPSAYYDGLIGGTSPALVAHGGAQSGIQVRLSPLGARALLGVPAGVLAGQDVAATEVLGGLADELQEQLAEADGWAARFAILDRTFTRRLAGAQAPPPPVSEAWRLLLGSGGQLPVAAIASQVGWSERQFAKRFRQEIGLTPKTAARVVRFHRARHELQARLADDGGTDVAAVAASCGYFDQPHLVRDFRQFAGLPPSRWLREEFRNVQAWAGHPDLTCGP